MAGDPPKGYGETFFSRRGVGMAKVKTKKRIFNAIMAVAAVAIVVAGVMLVLDFKGAPVSTLSEPSSTTTLTTCEKTGNVNIVRSGLGYALEDDTALKAGDQVETLSSSGISLAQDETVIYRMGPRTTTVIQDKGETKSASLKQGTALVWARGELGLTLCDDEVTVDPSQGALLLLSQEQGSASIAVLGGSVECKGVDMQASEGEAITLLKKDGAWDASTDAFSDKTLQDATIKSVQAYLEEGAECLYTSDELQEVADERASEREKAQQEAVDSGVGSQGSSGEGASGDTLPTCTIEIRCDTILNNMADLTPGKESYVPSNGTILATSTVSFKEGDTVFDVLTAACKAAGIPLEYTFSTMYGSNYIEGINNLYEFDCGEESGWMYKVNGWFPNYGCSKYELSDGDVIVWCYTCKGLGADVGGEAW